MVLYIVALSMLTTLPVYQSILSGADTVPASVVVRLALLLLVHLVDVVDGQPAERLYLTFSGRGERVWESERVQSSLNNNLIFF